MTAVATSHLHDEPIAAGTAASGGPARATFELLRELLYQQGCFEAYSDKQDGFYLVIESADEVSVQYSVNERESGPKRWERMRHNEMALLGLCQALARTGGHAFTLFVSPRTLALHVRAENTDVAVHRRTTRSRTAGRRQKIEAL